MRALFDSAITSVEHNQWVAFSFKNGPSEFGSQSTLSPRSWWLLVDVVCGVHFPGVRDADVVADGLHGPVPCLSCDCTIGLAEQVRPRDEPSAETVGRVSVRVSPGTSHDSFDDVGHSLVTEACGSWLAGAFQSAEEWSGVDSGSASPCGDRGDGAAVWGLGVTGQDDEFVMVAVLVRFRFRNVHHETFVVGFEVFDIDPGEFGSS